MSVKIGRVTEFELKKDRLARVSLFKYRLIIRNEALRPVQGYWLY